MTRQELDLIERELEALDERSKRTDEDIEQLKTQLAETLEQAEALRRRLAAIAAAA
jgi:cell division septum initiation protein DivIVA